MSKKKSFWWHIRKEIKETLEEFKVLFGLPILMLIIFGSIFYFLGEPHIFNTQRIEGVCTDVQYYSQDVFYRRYPKKYYMVTVDEEEYIIPESYFLTVLRNKDKLESIIGKEVVLEYSKHGRLRYKAFRICALKLADGSMEFISLEDAVEYSNEDSPLEICIILFIIAAGTAWAIYLLPILDFDGFKRIKKLYKRKKEKEKEKLTEHKKR